MRLIDADAMIADLLTVDPQYETMIQWCCTVVDAQPTIEERKTGRWIDGHCSICGCDVPAYIIDWRWQKDMGARYCPNCGAKMEVERERAD